MSKKKHMKLAALMAVTTAMGMEFQPKSGEAVEEPEVCIICGRSNLSGKGECCSKGCFQEAKRRAKETLVPNAAEAWEQERADLQRYERSLDNVERD